MTYFKESEVHVFANAITAGALTVIAVLAGSVATGNTGVIGLAAGMVVCALLFQLFNIFQRLAADRSVGEP